MSYPFSGNRHAQSGSDHYPTSPQNQYHQQEQHYYDPYEDAAYSHSTNPNEAYYSQHGYGSYEEAEVPEATYADGHRSQGLGGYGDEDDLNSPRGAVGTDKLANEGNSPYYASQRGMDDAAYDEKRGGSMWQPDQKRAMHQRSIPAKICRVFFCTIFTTIFVIISVISLVVVFARPFNVGVGDIAQPTTSDVGISGNALTFNGFIDFIISNPNSISSGLTIDAKVYDTVDKSQDIGRGSISNEKIEPHANTTIKFPYQIRYDPSKDADKTIFKDLAVKCGLTGGSSQDLNLDIDVNAKVKILSISVPVSFSRAMNIACPISASILKQLGGNDLSSIIGSIGRRDAGHGSATHGEL